MAKGILSLIAGVCFAQLLYAVDDSRQRIDRYGLVNRHNVVLDAFDKMAPLSVGNGKFTFTADLTGLQTFLSFYDQGIGLSTMAEWGWHTIANTDGYKYEDTLEQVDTYGRKVTYNINMKSPAANYFRANPHQSNLAQLGFILLKSDGTPASADNLENPKQTLNLWEGILKSEFQIDGKKVAVETFCHPELDMIAVNVKSGLLQSGRLQLSLRFPYATAEWGPRLSDWKQSDRHTTSVLQKDVSGAVLYRQMDNLKYYCKLHYSSNTQLKEVARHEYRISPSGEGRSLQLCVLLSQENAYPVEVDFQDIRKQCKKHWKSFWSSNGAIDLSASKDRRWKELERRIVLSQYLTAIQSVQKYPPQETGLTCNSWHGKFHLEMHWWHGVHFALWDRLAMLERSLNWYTETMPAARKISQRQGYRGVRWPKMVGPDAVDAPSGIGPLLIWQQPHPIYYAELIYRQKPTRAVLEQYRQIVQETAEFMASYCHWNDQRQCFELGPPLITAREFDWRAYAKTKNPSFELAYWSWGLKKANQWRHRLGLERNPLWDKIANKMAPLPVEDGIYVEMEKPLVADGGHPCMLAAYGLLPGSDAVNQETMRRTLKHVMANWDWESTWGWDYPMIAMCAARLGEGRIAVDALLKDVTKNTYLPNGHNFQETSLPIYLPGNGGLLTAVAMMAAGWDGCPDRATPGFPDDGQWTVKYEGLKKMP
ncbi:MAG: hypothetical protein ACYTBP_07560 [Planctomycetota bacterium]|jgi:hypothetical protein